MANKNEVKKRTINLLEKLRQVDKGEQKRGVSISRLKDIKSAGRWKNMLKREFIRFRSHLDKCLFRNSYYHHQFYYVHIQQ